MGISNKMESVVKKNLYDRVSQLLESYEWSDCTFLVSGTEFKAHKLLLGISSPVFKAMFYGPLSTDQDVVICDIDPHVFQLLLNYVYTDKIDLSSVEEAFELLYASKKYMLEYLTEKCKQYIEENISVDNVMAVLNYADFIQEKQLFNLALSLFCAHSDYLIRRGIENISVSSLRSLLECGQINTLETTLIRAVFEWTNHYCNYNGITASIENRRRVLLDSGLLQLMRFLVLTEDELDSILSDNNLLLPEEVDFVKNNIKNDAQISKTKEYKKNILNKIKNPRQSLKFTWHFCHRSALRSATPLRIDSMCNKVHIRMKCNKTVFINSLGVRTRMAPQVNFRADSGHVYAENFSILIAQEADNVIVKKTNFINTVEYDASIFVDFGEPCIINRDIWYKISFIWPNNKYHIHKYVVCHRNRLCNHKVKFEFDDMTENSDICGSFLEGLKYSF